MGIRFHCPNGHRLNVKSYLGGKRGYCPNCGIKLLIPVESESRLLRKSNGSPEGPPAAETKPEGSIAQLLQSTGVPSVGEPSEENWYVRPPSGGQFGPASAEIINQWVSERRIPAESLLWHEGWHDWRPAFEVLTPDGRLEGNRADAYDDVLELGLGSDEAPEEIAIQTDAVAPIARKRRQRPKLPARAAVFLGLAALVLLAALLLITTSRS
jgi:hypothetical protein